jgi:hypothetical protein
LFLEANSGPGLSELAFLEISLEGSKANNPARWSALLHTNAPLQNAGDFSMAGQKFG